MGTGSTNSAGQTESAEAGAEYLETIALLQEEIARLENELLARDESCQGVVADGLSSDDDVAPGDLALARESARLAGELASRDETINLLLDQLRLVEEAEAASRAEWEQLAHWVAELEERVDQQSSEESGAQSETIAAALRRADDAQSVLDRERETWIEKRRELEQQIEHFQAMIEQQTAGVASRQGTDAGSKEDAAGALALLESENRRLRRTCKALEETGRNELRVMGDRLEVAERELEAARKAHDAVQDEHARERREFQIAVASLRAQTARASVAGQEIHGQGTSATAAAGSSALEADMRIRAFRQHLQEIHSHEAESRSSKRLGSRLSRLWSRTVPK
jgi:hypothetical protein